MTSSTWWQSNGMIVTCCRKYMHVRCPSVVLFWTQIDIKTDKQLSNFIHIVLPPSSGLSISRTIILTSLNLLVSSNRKMVTGFRTRWFTSHNGLILMYISLVYGDRGSTVVKVLFYNSEGRWFDPSWCQWIFHWHKIPLIALWPWGRLSL